MYKKVVIFIGAALLFISNKGISQEFYWVGFKNKNETTFSLNAPEKYLSERALQRRFRQNIPIDSLDLPVNFNYIQQVTDLGVELVHSSKWLNGITVKSEIDSFETKVLHLSFVKEVQLTKPGISTKSTLNKFVEFEGDENGSGDNSEYGQSAAQIDLMNGQFLHDQNYLGQGMQIAVLDAGFYNADIYPAFDSLWYNNLILGVKDFVDPSSDIFQTHFHGMSVLSCMGGNVPGELIGTAPKSSYWLLRSEDASSEFLIEEDNWVAAAEFADSVGCDIINSSLGYSEFNDSSMDHTFSDLDGNTTRVTKAANIAFSRGILVFNSAGNEGSNSWNHIVAPADGDNVIAVGAVAQDSVPAFFTSPGPSADGDVKPNISGLGYNAYVVKTGGELGYGSGTSFSSPVTAGMVACLWQVNPSATANEVKNIIEMSSHKFLNPDSLLGYGIPDMSKAFQLMTDLLAIEKFTKNNWLAYPNPVIEKLILSTGSPIDESNLKIDIYSMEGKLLRSWVKSSAQLIELNNLNALPPGILFLKIEYKDDIETIKLSKIW